MGTRSAPLTLSNQEIIDYRWQQLCQMFGKADSVISMKSVGVEAPHNQMIRSDMESFPAWSDGDRITFNRTAIGNPATMESIVRITGLNWHEVSHVLFSPRIHGRFFQEIQRIADDNKVPLDYVFQCWNILEDQRIESMFVALYPDVVGYFVEAISSFLTNDQKEWPFVYSLLHGRTYLERDIRKQFRKLYFDQQSLGELGRIISAYKQTAWPRDRVKQLALVDLYVKLMKQSSAQLPSSTGSEAAHVGVPGPNGQPPDFSAVAGKTDPDEKLQIIAIKRMKDQEAEEDAEPQESNSDDEDADSQDEESEDDSNDGSGGGADDDDDSDSENDGDSDSDDGSDSSDGDEDSEDEGSNDSDGEGSNAGQGTGDHEIDDDPVDVNDLLKQLTVLKLDVYNSPEVGQDAHNKLRAIKDMSAGLESNATQLPFRIRKCTVDMVSQTRKVAKEYKELRAELDPYWEDEHDEGKLDINRAVLATTYEDRDRIFKQWIDGKDEVSDIEVVLDIDVSISMDSFLPQLSQQLWILKRSLELADAKVTVLAYDTGAFLLQGKSQRADKSAYREYSDAGGTNPTESLKDARRILAASKAKHRLFIILTDGSWNGTPQSEALIEEFNKGGVTTALFFLGSPQTIDSHKCSIAVGANEPQALVTLARKMVRKALRGK